MYPLSFDAFDGPQFALHLLGIITVAAFVCLGEWLAETLPSAKRVGVSVVICTGATAIAYAYLYDSHLLLVFDTKGALLIWGLGLVSGRSLYGALAFVRGLLQWRV